MPNDLTRKKDCGNIDLTKCEKDFLAFCQEFGWGKIEVTIKNGQPVMASPIKQDYKFD